MVARTAAPSSTTSWPATHARPAVGGSSVVSMWTVVDLPAPFGPRNPYTSPGSTRRSMPSTARGPFLNSLTRPWVSIAASDMPPTLRGGQAEIALLTDVSARARLVLVGRGLAREMGQVLDRAHAVHARGP